MSQEIQIVILFALMILNGVVFYAWKKGLKNMDKKKKSPFPDSKNEGESGDHSTKKKFSDLQHIIWPFIAVLVLIAFVAVLLL